MRPQDSVTAETAPQQEAFAEHEGTERHMAAPEVDGDMAVPFTMSSDPPIRRQITGSDRKNPDSGRRATRMRQPVVRVTHHPLHVMLGRKVAPEGGGDEDGPILDVAQRHPRDEQASVDGRPDDVVGFRSPMTSFRQMSDRIFE